MPSVERDRELRRLRRRKAKLRKYKARLAATREGKERERLLNKLRKSNPNVPLPEK